jgi:hypothetical protein
MSRELTTQDENITAADLLSRPVHPDVAPKPELSPPIPSAEEVLFGRSDADSFRQRWNDIQTSFVDEPKPSVERADQLVASVIQKLTEVFADERSKLEKDWSNGDEASTEDLRQALRRYRSFFDRLLSI